MCLRKHTDWSCGHHTIDLSQCKNPPARSCLSVLFGRRSCHADDVLRIRDEPCRECRQRKETLYRRNVERGAKREEMRASYEAHRASRDFPRAVDYGTGGDLADWEGVIPRGARGVAVPEPMRVHESVRKAVDRGAMPPSRDRPQVSREAYNGAAVGNQWDPKSPRRGLSSLPDRRNSVSPRHGLSSPRTRRDPRRPRDGPGRAPEEWVCVPLY